MWSKPPSTRTPRTRRMRSIAPWRYIILSQKGSSFSRVTVSEGLIPNIESFLPLARKCGSLPWLCQWRQGSAAKWITIHANPKLGRALEIFIPKTVTTMLRHFDQDERESDGSRHWEGIESVLLRKLERDGVQDFSDEVWLQQLFEGSSKKRTEYCKNKDGILCYLRAIHGHSGGFPIEPELMGYAKNPPNWKKYIYQRGLMVLSVHIGTTTDSRRKGERQSPSSSFLKLMIFFWDDLEEEESYDDFTVPQKACYVTKLKYYQNAVYWVRWSKTQDQGLEFWQTKSFAIMTHATILGGCIGRVTCPMENELISKGLNFQGRFLRWRWKRIGKASSSSIPLLVQTCLALWNEYSERALDKKSTRRFETFHWSDNKPRETWADCFWRGNLCSSQKGRYHRHDLTDWSCERRGEIQKPSTKWRWAQTRSVSAILGEAEYDV